ncbi:hypothetical protein LTR85_001021 [Meristemomyces frigidus]|nr:hypothetical protein LTR85_001021 [Meristemomyces frigidus]
MPPNSTDLVRLARLDATLWEDSRYVYVRHLYYGWREAPLEEYVWKRTHKPIGQGGFGAVFREECIQGSSRGAVRAVKTLQKPTTSNAGSLDYSRELEAIARFSEPQYTQYFVKSPGWYETDDAIFVVMELVLHGSLQQHMGSGLPEGEAQLIVAQVLQGLSYMHQAGYAPRSQASRTTCLLFTKAQSKYALALTLYHQQRYSEAERLFQESAQQREKVLGAEHEDTLRSKHRLADTLRK